MGLKTALFFALLAVVSCEEVQSPLQAVAQSNDEFTIALQQQFNEDLSENLITSPISLEVVLGMTAQGAKGVTRTQMLSALHLPEDDNTVRVGFKQLLAPLKSNENMTLHIADGIFVQKDYPLSQEFTNVAKTDFRAETKAVNYETELPASIDTINQWVEEETNHLIKDLVSEDSVTPDTRLVLVNALYFKGIWQREFNASLTKKRDFYINEKDTVKADIMMAQDQFGYMESEELGAQILELKYRGDEVRLVLVLPNEIGGLAETAKKLRHLEDIPMNIPKRDVIVYIPKFKIEQTIQYGEILQKLGMEAVFSPAADLSGITTAEELYISDVVQKSFIEVNEEGSEAAAATGVVVDTESVHDDYIFNADHGFIYFLQHIPTKSILFYGHYVKP